MPRPTPFEALRVALADQHGLLVEAFLEADPSQPSRVEGWTVADLERHVSLTAVGLVGLARQDGVSGKPTGVRAWADALPGLADRLDAEARTATAPPLDEAATQVQVALADADPQRLVEQWTGVHTLADAVLFRLVEAVVHGLDLPTPVAPDRRAAKLVCRALTQVVAERAPGKTVELRVPPYAAVQCLTGLRHTRGTPPNVVEVEPVAFLQLATGRLEWDTALADGRVRASGERAHLVAAELPVLT